MPAQKTSNPTHSSRRPGRPAGRTAADGVIADRDMLLAAAEKLIADKGPGVSLAAIAMGFIWIDAMGRDLKDPYEGTPNDIPMTAITVTIERDLLQMLGETELPEPVRPVKGVLM